MKTKLISFLHAENGLSLFVVPETETERELLAALWRHGKLELCNGIADNSSQGFSVTWSLRTHASECES